MTSACPAAYRSHMDDLSDNLHPGPEGCAVMAELLPAQNFVRDLPRTDMDEEEI